MKENKKTKTSKLFLNMFFPLLTIVLVSGGLLAFVSNNVIKRYVQTSAFISIERLNSNITAFFTPVELTISNFARTAEKNHDEEVLRTTLYSLADGIDFSNGLYYGSRKSRFDGGMYLDSTGWDPPSEWEPANRPWFKGADRENGKIHFEEPYIDDQTKNLCVTVAKGVMGKDGKAIGVVAVDLMMDEIDRMVSDISVSEHGALYVLSSDGKYLTNDDPGKITVADYFSDSAIREEASAFLDGELKAVIKKGRYYAAGRIGDTPWFIMAEGPVSDFSSEFTRIITYFEILITFLSIFFAFFNLKVVKNLRAGDRSVGRKIFTESQNLVLASKENASTAQSQSSSIKEIVATMEDNNAMSENIATKIKDVASVANATNDNVADGVCYLEVNVKQLQEIAEANTNTIESIKELGGKIENIWDIVTIINSVADQAKIIAFNAELEASSAGKEGKNFHIVATEIRRLADSIIDGTKEIKESISEIQKSSDNLILMSESGTEKIKVGVENAKSLENSFNSIKNASEITASSATDITSIIQQQAVASEKILEMLRQISHSVVGFETMTGDISTASEKLKEIAALLN